MRITPSIPARATALVGVAILAAGCGGSSSNAGKTVTRAAPTVPAPSATTSLPASPPTASDRATTTPGADATSGAGNGGTTAPSGGGGAGSGGTAYPNQPAPNGGSSPADRFKRYCAQNPKACGD